MRKTSRSDLEVMVIEKPEKALRAVCVRVGRQHEIAAGGVRVVPSNDLEWLERKATSLAIAMQQKCALSRVGCDGMKIVMNEPPAHRRREAFLALGDWLEEHQGILRTSGDLGTTNKDLSWLAETTGSVHLDDGSLSDSVFRTVQYGLDSALEIYDLEPSAFEWVLQGLGSIGAAVAHGLGPRSWNMVYWDRQEVVAKAAQRQYGGRITTTFDPKDRSWCWLPCAAGPVLTRITHPETLPRLICGGANCLVEDPKVAKLAHALDCLVVPDVLTSAGAVIAGIGSHLGGAEAAERCFSWNRKVVHELLRRSQRDNVAPMMLLEDLLLEL